MVELAFSSHQINIGSWNPNSYQLYVHWVNDLTPLVRPGGEIPDSLLFQGKSVSTVFSRPKFGIWVYIEMLNIFLTCTHFYSWQGYVTWYNPLVIKHGNRRAPHLWISFSVSHVHTHGILWQMFHCLNVLGNVLEWLNIFYLTLFNMTQPLKFPASENSSVFGWEGFQSWDFRGINVDHRSVSGEWHLIRTSSSYSRYINHEISIIIMRSWHFI